MGLIFHGHTFAAGTSLCQCHRIADAKRAVVVDPTNTGKLRNLFRSAMRQRWSQMRELTKLMLKERDLLALKSGGLMQVHAPAITGAGSKIDVFQRWFDLALQNAVLQKDGSFMRSFLTEGYATGTKFAQLQAKTTKTHVMAGHREAALQSLARIELEGIIEAVSQQAVRAVSEGLLTNANTMAIVRRVLNVIEKVGVNRTNAMIELLVVRAHAEASLDIYEAAGLATVGLVPESRAQAKVVTDEKAQSKAQDATQTADAKRRGKGPGSRVSRKSVPSSRTIRRIRASELRVAKALGENVNVRTAGDDDVCPVCEQIAEDGPYSINTARALIPAHPHCRCLFVPADDARFAQEDSEPLDDRIVSHDTGLTFTVSDYNPNHDPETGRFSEGGGGAGSPDLSPEELAAVKEYSGALTNSEHGGYANVQSHLRENKLTYPHGVDYPALKQSVAHLNSAFNKSRLPSDMTLHRGMRVDPGSPILNAQVGNTISDPGVTSTSTSKEIVKKKFSWEERGRRVSVQMEIKARKGSKGINMNVLKGRENHEKEVALAPHTVFKVTSHKVKGKTHHIKLEIV